MYQNPIRIGKCYYQGMNPFGNSIYVIPTRLSLQSQVEFNRIVLCPEQNKYFLARRRCSRREWVTIRGQLLSRLGAGPYSFEKLVEGLTCSQM